MVARIDELLFYLFFNLSADSPVLEPLMVTITNWSGYFYAAVYVSVIVFLLWRKSKDAVPVIVAPALAFSLVHVARQLYFRPRPFYALEIDSLIYHAANSSLPSLHATSAFVIAAVIWCFHKKLGTALLVIAGVVGISRVMVGVHFPLDIAAGAILGATIALGSFKLNQLLFNKYRNETC